MARIVGGSMIGELSGKLGGNVFARNKAGAYIRQYVIPVDPNSQAQSNARESFGAASSAYHSLTSTQKNQWQNFATNLYLPKNGANTGQFSGFNAFTSLRNLVVNAQRLQPTTFVTSVSGAVVVPDLVGNFIPLDTPPATTIQANLALASGTPVAMYLTNGTVATTGEVSFNLNLGGSITPAGGNLNPILQDGAGNSIGFAVYLSNPVQQSQMFINNPELICAGVVPPVELLPASALLVSSIGFEFTAINPTNYQAWYSEGDWVRMTVYSVSTGGQTIRIGSITVQV